MTRCYILEIEHLPGKWRPLRLPPYDHCKEAREACDTIRRHTPARIRVARYKFDGLTHGKRPRQ